MGRLLPCAAALACMPAFAQSTVTLYGAVDDALTYVSNQKGHSNVYMRQGNLYASKFGLQGKEDLGNGTTAIFDLQNGFDLNTGALSSSGLMFNRQAYVGLQNARFGTLTAGRQYTPYYMFVGPLTGSSWLTGATGAHPGDIDGLDTTVRINNSLVYTSPNWGGFQASAMYALGGIAGSTGKGQTYSGALRYLNGPVTLSLGYLRMNNAQQTTGFDPASTGSFGVSALNAGYVSAKAIQHVAAAGNYTLGNLTLGLSYSNVEYRSGAHSLFGSTAVFNTYAALGVYRFTPQFDAGAGVAFTAASKSNGIGSAARYAQYSLKEAYHLSKRTTLYALQGYQHASGQTLNAAGSIVDAAPSVGDSQNGTPSATHGQFVGMLGIATLF
nr:porin [Trinickia dabaoshanensis]